MEKGEIHALYFGFRADDPRPEAAASGQGSAASGQGSGNSGQGPAAPCYLPAVHRAGAETEVSDGRASVDAGRPEANGSRLAEPFPGEYRVSRHAGGSAQAAAM